jgi:hypothetical protein
LSRFTHQGYHYLCVLHLQSGCALVTCSTCSTACLRVTSHRHHTPVRRTDVHTFLLLGARARARWVARDYHHRRARGLAPRQAKTGLAAAQATSASCSLPWLPLALALLLVLFVSGALALGRSRGKSTRAPFHAGPAGFAAPALEPFERPQLTLTSLALLHLHHAHPRLRMVFSHCCCLHLHHCSALLPSTTYKGSSTSLATSIVSFTAYMPRCRGRWGPRIKRKVF